MTHGIHHMVAPLAWACSGDAQDARRVEDGCVGIAARYPFLLGQNPPEQARVCTLSGSPGRKALTAAHEELQNSERRRPFHIHPPWCVEGKCQVNLLVVFLVRDGTSCISCFFRLSRQKVDPLAPQKADDERRGAEMIEQTSSEGFELTFDKSGLATLTRSSCLHLAKGSETGNERDWRESE